MKSGLEKKDFRIYFIVILGILLIVLFGNVKEGYFIDELYSYGLSNAEYKTDISDYDIYNTELKNSNESPFFKYMTVGENERFNYISVYKNQIRDVHPPLYYMILNTVCSLTPNVFNKWSGIGINLAIYIGIMLIFYTICKEVYQNKNLSLIACLVYTISAASIGMNIYIGVRFYKTMYSGIGYFTNTLPLKKHEIILSKIIPAAIAQTIVNLMIIVSGVIIFCGFIFATDRFGDLMLYIARFKGGILGNFTMLNGMGIVLGIVFGCLFAIIQTVFNTLLLFLAVSIGQLFNSYNILMSVIIFIVMNVGLNAVDGIINMVTGALVHGIFMHSPGVYSIITMILIGTKNIIIAVIAYAISYRILRDKLNLE